MLSACGGGLAETSEAHEKVEQSAISSNDDTGPSPRTFQNLARTWGFDGYVRCGWYTMVLAADATKTQNQETIEFAKSVLQIVGTVKPLVNVDTDSPRFKAAFTMFQQEHQREPQHLQIAGIQKCLNEIKVAAQV